MDVWVNYLTRPVQAEKQRQCPFVCTSAVGSFHDRVASSIMMVTDGRIYGDEVTSHLLPDVMPVTFTVDSDITTDNSRSNFNYACQLTAYPHTLLLMSIILLFQWRRDLVSHVEFFAVH